jgi:hypothetical protein
MIDVIGETEPVHQQASTAFLNPLNLSNFPQSSKRRSHGSSSRCSVINVLTLDLRLSALAISRQAILENWIVVRNCVSSSSYCLLASLAGPNAYCLSLYCCLSAESAHIFRVLGDFHFLDLLSERSAISKV